MVLEKCDEHLHYDHAEYDKICHIAIGGTSHNKMILWIIFWCAKKLSIHDAFLIYDDGCSYAFGFYFYCDF